MLVRLIGWLVATVEWFERVAKDKRGVTDTVTAVAAALITLAIVGVIYYYTLGIGVDLAGSITDTNMSTTATNFLTSMASFGGAMFNFIILLIIAMVGAIIIAFFRGRLGGGGGGV